jgi:hypothetical protein
VDEELIELMEALVASIEQRDASDPDAPPWEAQRRIERLEEELARRVRRDSGAALAMARPDEALVGTV